MRLLALALAAASAALVVSAAGARPDAQPGALICPPAGKVSAKRPFRICRLRKRARPRPPTPAPAQGPPRATGQPATSLHITVTPGSRDDGQSVEWTLTCDPAGGTHPRPAEACARLAELSDPFAETAMDVGCILIYGGPQVAHVTGLLRGAPVDARFSRTDGCEIRRWNRVSFLFPAA